MKFPNEVQKCIEEGLLSVRSTIRNGTGYDILCYTKDQFFNGEWEDVTISHRGKIYRDDGKIINSPFKKIFNLNEQSSTSFDEVKKFMETQEYEVLDKVNGHLVIVSYDIEKRNVLVSTKGSFEGFAEMDDLLAFKLGIHREIKRSSPNITFMFECLADYDKHLWFEDQLERYSYLGENTLILLGATDNNTSKSLTYQELENWAWIFGVPITHRYTHLEETSDINAWFDHKGIEGYVIHFPWTGFRVKIKTKEYCALRYMKEISVEKLVNFLYNSGKENMYRELDEELYPIIDALLMDVEDFVFSQIKSVNDYMIIDKKHVSMDSSLTNMQKVYLFGNKTKSTFDRICDSKLGRTMFKEHGKTEHVEKAIRSFFGDKFALLSGIETV